MTDNISVNVLEPRPGQPGSENPNIIIPPSVRPTGHSKKKNRKQLWTASYLFWWRWRLCRLQILPCRRTETLLQNRKTKCIFLLSCDEVTINAVKRCSHLQRGKYPTVSPVWTSATQSHGGSELEESTEQALRHAATSTLQRNYWNTLCIIYYIHSYFQSTQYLRGEKNFQKALNKVLISGFDLCSYSSTYAAILSEWRHLSFSRKLQGLPAP